MDYAYAIELNIPEGYTIQELPESIHLELPKQAAVFDFEVNQEGNKLTISSILNLQQSSFPAKNYKEVRSFFEALTQKNSEAVGACKIQLI